MKPKIFKNIALQQKIEKSGFVKIKFWDEKTAIYVAKNYFNLFDEAHTPDKLFHTTYETVNIELVNRVNHFLQPLFLKAAEHLLENVKPISAGFLVKEKGETSITPLHQDASFVDEPNHCSFSIWVALTDCTTENGALQFIPGSHLLANGVRTIPYDNKRFEPFYPTLYPFLTQETVKAGEGYVFYNAVLHASPPNTSNQKRVAAVMGFYDAGAQLSLYLKQENKAKRYLITPEELIAINDTFDPVKDKFISEESLPEDLNLKKINRFIYRQFGISGRIKASIKSLKTKYFD